MPSDFSVYFTSRLIPGADTLRSLAAPPMVPVTMTARITSTWRSVIICPKLQMPCPVRHQRGPPAFGIFSNQKKRNREVDPSNTEIVVFYIDHNPLSANDASLA